MSTFEKGIHEICIDKTSCKHESLLNNQRKTEDESPSMPTEKLTKDSIRKSYEQNEKEKH